MYISGAGSSMGVRDSRDEGAAEGKDEDAQAGESVWDVRARAAFLSSVDNLLLYIRCLCSVVSGDDCDNSFICNASFLFRSCPSRCS